MTVRASDIEDVRQEISKIGVELNDGSSLEPGTTYHPIPFEEFKDIPYHKDACVKEWQLLETIEDFTDKSVLEIGCANGYFSFNMAKHAKKVDAFETDSQVCKVNEWIKDLKAKDLEGCDLNFIPHSPVTHLDRDNEYDICVMLNVHMWLVKQHGLGTTLGLLRNIAKNCKVLYFQTAHAESEGMYLVEQFKVGGDIVDHLNDAGFDYVECVSANELHGKVRYMYRATSTEKVLFRSDKTEIKLLKDGTVAKIHLEVEEEAQKLDHPPTGREASFLLELSGYNSFPELLSVSPQAIRMSYCGEPLTKELLPEDTLDQLSEILATLQARNIRHNDIKPSELTVLDGKIHLVDLEWATHGDDPLPVGEDGPKDIGGAFRCPAGYNDAYSLLKSLNAIETQS